MWKRSLLAVGLAGLIGAVPAALIFAFETVAEAPDPSPVVAHDDGAHGVDSVSGAQGARSESSPAAAPMQALMNNAVESRKRELRVEVAKLREFDELAMRVTEDGAEEGAAFDPVELEAIAEKARAYREQLEALEHGLRTANGGSPSFRDALAVHMRREQLRQEFLSSLRGREVLWLASEGFLGTSPRRADETPSLVAWMDNKRVGEKDDVRRNNPNAVLEPDEE